MHVLCHKTKTPASYLWPTAANGATDYFYDTVGARFSSVANYFFAHTKTTLVQKQKSLKVIEVTQLHSNTVSILIFLTLTDSRRNTQLGIPKHARLQLPNMSQH